MFHSKWDRKTVIWSPDVARLEQERTMALRYMEQLVRFGRPHTLDEALNLLYAQQGDDLVKFEEFFRQLFDRQPISQWYNIMQDEYDRLGAIIVREQAIWWASHRKGA